MEDLLINVFGISVLISTESDFVFQNLRKDFALFSSAKSPHIKDTVTLSIHLKAPEYDKIPALDAAVHGHGFISYKDKDTNYIVYSKDALLIYDFKHDHGEFFGTNELFLYEKTKLTILTRIGEKLEGQGLRRIHAFGVSLNHKALVCLLPMEGGKTTSVLNLLKADQNIKIIADDVCFIDRQGTIYPFLLRIGARDQKLIEGIPEEYTTRLERPHYGIKYFIEPEYFRNRISMPLPVTHMLIGKRSTQSRTTIMKLPKLNSLGPIMDSGIFGAGLPQLFELLVRGDYRMFTTRLGTIMSRLFFCVSMILKTKTAMIKIGLDQSLTCKKILEYLNSEN